MPDDARHSSRSREPSGTSADTRTAACAKRTKPLLPILLSLLSPLSPLSLPSPADGGQAPPPVAQTAAALDRQLEMPVELLRWSGKPLREALESLSATQGVALFLDRRIDPDQLLDFDSRGAALGEVLDQLAARLRLGTCRVGAVIYLGPPETTAVLATVVELRKDQLQSAAAPGWKQARPLAWPQLATPRELLAQQAQDADVTIAGLEQIPHDLWPAVELPPLDFVERLSLLLAGFGRTFQLDQTGQLQLIPLPPTASLVRDYSVSPAQAQRLIELAGQQFPAARLARHSSGVRLEGPVEAHRAIESWLRGPSRPPRPAKPAAAEVRYTLEVKNQPRGAIAAALAQRLNLTLDYHPQAEQHLEEKISFRVEHVTREQLLEAVFAPAGLTFQIIENTLRVVPAADRR